MKNIKIKLLLSGVFFLFLSLLTVSSFSKTASAAEGDPCPGSFRIAHDCKVDSGTGHCETAYYQTYDCVIHNGTCQANVPNQICGFTSNDINSCKVIYGSPAQKWVSCGGGGGGGTGPTPVPGCTTECETTTECKQASNCNGEQGSYCGVDRYGDPKYNCTERRCTTVCVTPTIAPAPAYCQNIKAYNTSWVALTATQLSSQTAGSKVFYCVYGTAGTGTFTKARFTINGSLMPETTTVRPGTNDFCYLHTLPTGVTNFTIVGEIYNNVLGWLR